MDQAEEDVLAYMNFPKESQPKTDSPVIPPTLARRVSPIEGDLSEAVLQDRRLKQ